MDAQLVKSDKHEASAQWLREFYAKNLIPAEKKPFLIDLQRSAGPLLAVEGGEFILDVASQIASLGLGFNAGALFGAAQFLETWNGRTDTESIQTVRQALHDLFSKILGWPKLNLQLCSSGAEANEIALGACFELRNNRSAKKVIAFEGSFHGRMMVALASTYSPLKREPFAWPGFESTFVDYPELTGDDIHGPLIPNDWQHIWSLAPRADFQQILLAKFGHPVDELLAKEISILSEVRRHLKSGDHFAVMIEPMQCEGGDRYSSARFHNGLINLTNAFNISLVYDEIQTGFGLGGDFFWHQKFDLHDDEDLPIAPDFVVLAKKSQVAAVLSQDDIHFPEYFNAASLTRGFIHASMIDQFASEIVEMEKFSRNELSKLVKRFEGRIHRPRVSGLSFAFDFVDQSLLQKFVSQRFHHGLLYYPAGKHTARFRFNLAFRGELLEIAWKQIHAALETTFSQNEPTEQLDSVHVPVNNPDSYYDFHTQFINHKLASLDEQTSDEKRQPEQMVSQFILNSIAASGLDCGEFRVTLLDKTNYPDFRQAIGVVQTQVYEPLRQTPLKKFDSLIAAPNQLSIVVSRDGQIVAMAFAAPPINFPGERGVATDEFFEDPNTVYMLDLTVLPGYRGYLGRTMKQALSLLAQQRGVTAIQGRNRDRLARGMWAINLSLGSYCTRIISDDYLDEHPYRDCLMYRCEMDWQPPPLNLSQAMINPCDEGDLNSEFCQQNLSGLVNKLTLSNFITREYLTQLDRVFDLLPPPLKHGYSASGVSEGVDKIVKSIWLKRKPRTRIVTFTDSFFGSGGFLSRGLSGISESYFPVTRLPRTVSGNELEQRLRAELETDDVLAVFVEPLGWQTGQRMPLDQLASIRQICSESSTPLVSHDTMGMFYRYSREAFLPSALPKFAPDCGIIFLGGQMAVCFLSQELFATKPLTLISTWDGDAFSLAKFELALSNVETQLEKFFDTRQKYHEALTELLINNDVGAIELNDGIGWFRGCIQTDLARMFTAANNTESDTDDALRYISCPTFSGMRRFLNLSLTQGWMS